jgi:hypothetical protein
VFRKGRSAYNDAPNDIRNQTNEAELSDCVIKWFSRLWRPIDCFPAGAEPCLGDVHMPLAC